MNKRKIGSKGEALACAFLEAQGYEIVESNYHAGVRGELDVIARQEDVLVFVEVKMRSSDAFGSGREAVTRKKQQAISLAAQYYLVKNKLSDIPCRFDVIEILLENTQAKIDHIINAFDSCGKDW